MKNTYPKLSKLLVVLVLLLLCRFGYAHLPSMPTFQVGLSKNFEDAISIKKSQLAQKVNVEDTILTFAEKMPEFPGGKDSMMNFIVSNLKFPQEAYQNGISGKVFVQFAVSKEGKIYQIKVIKGIGGGCDEEVVRIVKLFPDWVPAYQSGKPVSVYYTMPILFEVKDGEDVLQFVEQMPEFPGGPEAMMKFLDSNIRYPSIATEMGITGRVILQFVVDKYGKINNVKVLRGIGGGCDEEAIRVVKSMPAWIPGKQNGKDVPVYFTLPVVFQKGEYRNIKPGKESESKILFNGFSNNLIMPEYPGGNDTLNVFLSKNFKYPEEAKRKNIEGTVRIGFVIGKDGKIKTTKVLQKVDTLLDAEALRLVGLFPDWKPALRDGKPVEYEYSLDFNFFDDSNKLKREDSKEQVDTSKAELAINVHNDEPLQFADRMPEFPGGMDAMMRFISQNIRYPDDATENRISGRVIATFVISEIGEIYNIKIIKSVGYGCDEEAVRVIKSMPPWKPGKQNGKDVPVYFTLPVVFQLKE